MANPRLAKLVNAQIRVITNDGRQLVGTLLAFDAHMNLVLDETQEFRKTRSGEQAQRAVGLVLLRGDLVMSTILETTYKGNQANRVATQPISMQL